MPEMEFRTVTEPLRGLQGLVGYGSPLFLAGSCFSDNIGGELESELFDVCVNPFGPLYNPLSILGAIKRLAGRKHVSYDELFCHEGKWRHWDFHSRCSAAERGETLSLMNKAIDDGAATLREASAIFITLGTTVCYSLAGEGHTVANCHKQPGKLFNLTRLTLGETAKALAETVETVRSVNAAGRTVFTVSPLRYLGGGVRENTLIKSTLHLAIEEVTTAYPDTIYFPAYEIMMDDLRDYRFYAEDMKHPAPQAVRYIYEIFRKSFCLPATECVSQAGRRITSRLGHRGSVTDGSPKELGLLDQYPALKRGYQRFTNQNR